MRHHHHQQKTKKTQICFGISLVMQGKVYWAKTRPAILSHERYMHQDDLTKDLSPGVIATDGLLFSSFLFHWSFLQPLLSFLRYLFYSKEQISSFSKYLLPYHFFFFPESSLTTNDSIFLFWSAQFPSTGLQTLLVDSIFLLELT